MTVSPSYLTSLFNVATDTTGTASLLGTSYGFASQTVSLSGQNPITALQSAEKNQKRDIQTTATEPAVKREVDAFAVAVKSAKSVQQLLANPRAMQVLLTANGLADQVPYAALARKVLQSDLKDPKSLANVLTDVRWKSVVQTYDFAHQGLAVIQKPKVIAAISDAYAEYTWRHSLEATTPGLSNALTFRSEAKTITSVDQILGDPVMRDVVTTTFGLPLQLALQPLEAQERAISTRLDIKKLQDPSFVEKFVQRYLLAAQANAAPTAAQTDLTSLAVQRWGLVV